MIEKIEANTRQKESIRQVYASYLKWFLGAFLLATLGTIGAYFFNAFYPLSSQLIIILQIFSLALEAATFGHCGYSIQTWDGVSPAERLNQKLFTWFASLGFLLVTFSFQLSSVQSV